tara:strand:+ start:4953 stop:7331 length:2379 start_codon:yes stop_codon:yes gene_type:complete
MAINDRPSNVDRSLLNPANGLSFEEDGLLEQENDFLNVTVEETDEEGAEVIFGEDVPMADEPENFFDNLAEFMEDSSLEEVSSYIVGSVEDDKSSREDWADTYTKGLDLLGLKYDTRTEPFNGATGVIHPILNEAVTQFQAQAYKEMLPSSGPVRATIVGTPSLEIEQQASRVQDYMNYQIMYQMEEYEPEFDQMLYYLGLAGSSFKKVYRDDTLGRPVSKFIPAEDVIAPYTATDLKSAERITHVLRMSSNELRKQQVMGFYRDIEISEDGESSPDEVQETYNKLEGRSPTGSSEDGEITLYECHCYLDIPEYTDVDAENNETGIKLPYIVTVAVDSGEVLSVRRNYSPDDVLKSKIPHFVQYKFTPGLGFYGFGLIHLLGNLSRTATANLRQLIDAGTLSNMPAGFKARGMRIADDQTPIQPGEFRDVDVPGGDLKASLMPLPYKEPSNTLFQLMGFVIESAQKFIGNTDIGVADGNQEMPVGTTIALLERGARIISAVHKRLHASMKQELRMLARLFAEDPAPYPYEVGADAQIKMQDFDNRVDVLPVSDPNIFSMSQRVVLAQEQLKLAQAAPELHNTYEAYRRMYEALGVHNIEQLLKPEEVPKPTDPATENQLSSAAAGGQSKLQAYPEQDHDSHIAVHAAYMNSQVAKMQPPVLMTLEKHIYEHLGMKAQVMHDEQMAQNPESQQQPPEEHNKMIAQMQAQVIAEYQQQNPVPEETDPLVEIKRQEVALKGQQVQADTQYDQQKLTLDAQKQQENAEIARERNDTTEDIAIMRANIAMQKQSGQR